MRRDLLVVIPGQRTRPACWFRRLAETVTCRDGENLESPRDTIASTLARQPALPRNSLSTGRQSDKREHEIHPFRLYSGNHWSASR